MSEIHRGRVPLYPHSVHSFTVFVTLALQSSNQLTESTSLCSDFESTSLWGICTHYEVFALSTVKTSHSMKPDSSVSLIQKLLLQQNIQLNLKHEQNYLVFHQKYLFPFPGCHISRHACHVVFVGSSSWKKQASQHFICRWDNCSCEGFRYNVLSVYQPWGKGAKQNHAMSGAFFGENLNCRGITLFLMFFFGSPAYSKVASLTTVIFSVCHHLFQNMLPFQMLI